MYDLHSNSLRPVDPVDLGLKEEMDGTCSSLQEWLHSILFFEFTSVALTYVNEFVCCKD